jgi:predicted nucleic acid-binding protein
MDVWLIVVIVVIVLLLAAGAAAYVVRTRQVTGRRRLKERFGGEYDRVVERTADRTEAERELRRRVERRERLDIVDLSADERERYVRAWRDLQVRFVDAPEATLGDADRLITQAMRDRGYPTEHLDQKIDDLSVDHADTVNAYRAAHEIADRHERAGVSTDDLRVAMQRYRTVFEGVVGTRITEQTTQGSDAT